MKRSSTDSFNAIGHHNDDKTGIVILRLLCMQFGIKQMSSCGTF